MGFFRKFEDEIKDVGRKIDDELLQPAKDIVEAVIDDPKKLLAVGLAVAFPGAGAALGAQLGLTGTLAQVAGQAIINTTLNGGDVKSAVIGAVLPTLGQAGADVIGQTLTDSGITGTVNTVLTRAVTQGTTAALLGKDPAAAFLLGGVSAGVTALTENIPGFSDLPEFTRNAISSAVVAKFTDTDVATAVTGSLIDDALDYATTKINEYKAQTGGITNRVVDEAIPQGDGVVKSVTSDLSNRNVTDSLIGSSVADYLSNDKTLFSGVTFPKLEGIKTELITDADFNVGESDVDYSLVNVNGTSRLDGLGLNLSTSPNLDLMGGGQGLSSGTATTVTDTVIDATEREGSLAKDTTGGGGLDIAGGLRTAASILGGVAGVGAINSAIDAIDEFEVPSLQYGDIYKDAPLKGFSMRKDETTGRYTPFIGETALLAKGGFVSKPTKRNGLASRK